jgi:hypothetical protein
MRVMVSAEGRVTPTGAAELLVVMSEWEVIPRGGEIPDRVSTRIFGCVDCLKLFVADAGQAATHDCRRRQYAASL